MRRRNNHKGLTPRDVVSIAKLRSLGQSVIPNRLPMAMRGRRSVRRAKHEGGMQSIETRSGAVTGAADKVLLRVALKEMAR